MQPCRTLFWGSVAGISRPASVGNCQDICPGTLYVVLGKVDEELGLLCRQKILESGALPLLPDQETWSRRLPSRGIVPLAQVAVNFDGRLTHLGKLRTSSYSNIEKLQAFDRR